MATTEQNRLKDSCTEDRVSSGAREGARWAPSLREHTLPSAANLPFRSGPGAAAVALL